MNSRWLRWCTVFCLFSTLQAGEYADAYLLSSVFPVSQALGKSAVSLQLSSGHALNNPAGYAGVRASQLNLAYDQFNGISNMLTLEGIYPITDKYRLAATVIHSSIPGLYFRPDLSRLSPEIRRDSVMLLALENGETIPYREDAIFVSLAREYKFVWNVGWKYFKIPCRVPVGVSLKYLDKLLAENRGLGVGIDLGGQFIFSLGGMDDAFQHTEFSIGVILHDILNTPVYWETEHQDAIKRGLIRGVGIVQDIERFKMKISISTSKQSRYPDIRRWGAEIGLRDKVFIRAGHDGISPSFGLGIGLKKFIIDYTFSQHELSGMQRIGISYHF